jgi:transcriptional regulator of acetoin/glycerol metabolism
MTRDPIDRALARERERFLSGGAPVGVRPEIRSSWHRCSSWSMGSDTYAPRYRPDVDPESQLLRAANPVLDTVKDRLGELGISFIVTDSEACILDRRVSERGLLHALDARQVTPGFVFAEDAVGTNGLGTALELGRTVRIDGHEHYVDRLVQFTCVGAPIVDPISRRQVGVLDVTCAADHHNALVTLLAEQTARIIENRLFEQHSVTERALLARFLSASRRTHAGIVVLSERILLSNPQAARLLAGVEQPLVWDHAAQVMAQRGGSRPADSELVLAGGQTAATRMLPLRDGNRVIGVLVEIRPPRQQATGDPAVASTDAIGLAGTDRGFVAAYCAARAALSEHVVVLYGECGVGKFATARALHQERGHQPVVLDAVAVEVDGEPQWLDAVRAAVSGPPAGLVLRHLDLLSPAGHRTVGAILGAAAARGWRCVATVTCDASSEPFVLPEIQAERIKLPALRDRLTDVPALIGALAAPRRVAPEAVQLLMRLPWRGNVRELHTVLRRMLAASTRATVGLPEMPPDVRRAASRRSLSRFARAEVHAILDALAECAGNKTDAAQLLGISRSTLYRKLQAAGVDLDNTVF